MKKRLLFVMSNLQNGGAERSLVNLLQLIDYAKYSVDLLLFQECGMFLKQVPKEVNLVKQGAEKLHVLYDGNLKKSLLNLKNIDLNIKRIFATKKSQSVGGGTLKSKQYRWKNFYGKIIPPLKEHYDVAIAYLHGEQFYYVIDKVNADKKIGWVHNEYSKSGLYAKWDLPYFEKFDKIVTISDLCADVLVNEFPSQKDKFLVLPNLTSSKIIHTMADAFYPAEYDKDVLKVVSVGRLHPQKGFDMAIEAAKILKEKNFNFSWYILGSGILEKELEEQRKREGVEDVIKFIGSRENPYPYLKNADIVVQCSRFEGKSIVLDEAKILAKPIVATNYTTVRDQLNDKEALIVDMTSEAVADGIELMAKSKDGYSEYLSQNEYGNYEQIAGYYALFDE